MSRGIIIKATGGFYYVKSGTAVYECRARGIFRKEGISPLVGDRVEFSCEASPGVVEGILPRKNFLIRPAVANLDRLVVVSSVCRPDPDPYAIDKLLAIAELKGIEPVVVMSKIDLCGGCGLVDLYRHAGFHAVGISSVTCAGIDELRSLLYGHVSVFAGNSGVGKSSLINRIAPGLSLQTGVISRKLGRGRHTTRTVELFELDCVPEGSAPGFIVDTPGFSSLDIERSHIVRKEELQFAFRDFRDYIEKCRYTGCAHVKEAGCAVRKAVEDGVIERSRYQSYCTMYEEIRHIKEWEFNKNDNAT